MYYSQILDCDIANGLGWRISLFVSGCSLHCKGCFNPETWDYNFGKPFTVKTQNKILELLHPDYIRGLSVLGGNPTDEENEIDLVPFLGRVKEYYPNKDIWVWSGHTFEKLKERNDKILRYCDVLVDGPFIEKEKDLTIPFRGSRNQRLIDVKKTLESGKITEIEL